MTAVRDSPGAARLRADEHRGRTGTTVIDIVVGESLMSKDELDEAEAVVRAGSETYVTVGRALMAIRDGKGYRLRGYNTFEAYLDGVWDMRRRQGYRLISAAQVVLDGNFVSARTQNDALPTVTQARILASLPIEERAPLIEQGVLELPTRDLSTVVRAGRAELTERRDREKPQRRLPAPTGVVDSGARPARATILVGDVRAALATLDAESVQCVVTSVPYWGLRSYGTEPQIWGGDWFGELGAEPTPDLYVEHITQVFRAVRRVLRKDGTAWLNCGFSYAGSGKGPTGWDGVGDQEHRQGFKNSGFNERWNGSAGARKQEHRQPAWPAVDAYKPKDLIPIPFLVAMALQADGWYLRSIIAWCKKAPMPESVSDRPTSAWEPILLLSRAASYFYDKDAVMESTEGSDTHSRGNGYHPKMVEAGQGIKQNDSFSAATNGLVASRNMRNAWLLGPEPFPGAHFAVFPTEVPRRCILAGSRPGDVVLDPFGGAGTTSMVAARLGRDSVYVDLKPEYADMARDRIQADGGFTVDVELREVPG